MPITINGSGTVTGISAGGLPDGVITADDIAASAITRAKMGYAGAILQVVQTTKTSATAFASTSTYQDVSGMSVTITPASSSNKVLVTFQWSSQMNSWYGGYGEFRILRGATAIGAEPFAVQYCYSGGTGDNYADFDTFSITFLDSPSTTSATTYKLQAKNSSSRTIWFNSGYDSVTRNCSTVTAMEVLQ